MVHVSDEHGDRVVVVDGENHAKVLAANEHFNAATKHSPTGDLNLISRNVSAPADVHGQQAAEAMFNQHDFPNAVHSPNARIASWKNAGSVQFGLLGQRAGQPGGFVTYRPPGSAPRRFRWWPGRGR